MRLKDKVAVVLGASSEGGTGWAIAEALAHEGAKVVVAARSMEGLRRLASKIDGMAVSCHAGREAEVEALAQSAFDAYGHIDIAVNAAGLPTVGMIASTTLEQLQQSVEVNYFAHVWFIKHMAAKMNDGGAITIISSITATEVQAGFVAYGCAKSAADCLVRYAAVEYGPSGIRVNSIQPGAIKTPLISGILEQPGVENLQASATPLGRVGLPKDYADLVVYLSGPTFITGVNLPVSGGIHLTGMPRPHEYPEGTTFGFDIKA